MLLVVLIAGAVLALLALFLLHGTVFAGILALACFIAGMVLYCIRKKLPAKLGLLFPVLCCVLGCAALFFCGTKRDQGFGGYDKLLADAQKAMDQGEYDQAVALLEELGDTYGTDDNVHFLMALKNLKQADYPRAYQEAEEFANKCSIPYYMLMERICIEDPSEESVERVYGLYEEAAAQWPDWAYMQLYAGIALFEQGKYDQAQYYLLRAYQQDQEDPLSSYYLGASFYERFDYENGKRYFEEALERGADDTIKANILWYLERETQTGGDEA